MNTTDEKSVGVYTDQAQRTQLLLYDTPGATKASNSFRSRLLVTKAWDTIEEVDQVIFVVDAAKRLSFEVKESLKRLKRRADAQDMEMNRIMDQIEDPSVDPEYLQRRLHELQDKADRG